MESDCIIVGKETNRLEEVEAGLIQDPDEVYTEYADPGHGPWEMLVVPVLKRTPRRLIVERTGLSGRAITAIRNGRSIPHATHQEVLARAAADFARHQPRASGKSAPSVDLVAWRAHLTLVSNLSAETEALMPS